LDQPGRSPIGFGPAPNRSGIDITAGSKQLGIFGGVLIASIGEKGGSATALKQIVRAGEGPARMSERKWSEEDKRTITELNGTRIETGPLRLAPRDITTDGPLWIGARKGLPSNLREPFKSSFLRLDSRQKPSGRMERYA
jgi:hypothetical protein